MEILTDTQKEIMRIFSQTENSEDLYLTGGTALSAFYLFHRISDDLDFFTSAENLLNTFTGKFIEELKKNDYKITVSRSFNTFKEMFVEKGEKVKIHFALDSPFKFEEPIKSEYGIMVDSFIDIATNKLLTLFGRFAERDFIDIFFIVAEKKMDLSFLIEKSKEKDPGLDEYYLSIAFENIKVMENRIKKIKTLKPVNYEAMKDFFLENAVKLLDKRGK